MSVVLSIFTYKTSPTETPETTDFMSVVLQFRPTNPPRTEFRGDHRLHVGGASTLTYRYLLTSSSFDWRARGKSNLNGFPQGDLPRARQSKLRKTSKRVV
jgi:hypothetical protein